MSRDEGLVANPVAPVAALPELRRQRVGDIGHAVIPMAAGHRINRARSSRAVSDVIGQCQVMYQESMLAEGGDRRFVVEKGFFARLAH